MQYINSSAAAQETETGIEEQFASNSQRGSMNARAREASSGSSHEKGDSVSRKLALLRRSGLFGSDTKGATIERACSLQDLREAYRLVHAVYLGTGYIGAEPAGVRLRIFEMSSETATFIAKVDGRVVGVLSVVSDSPDLGLPSDAAFKPELDALRATGAKLCEVTNQAVADDFRKSAVSTELMRCAIALMMHSGHTEAVASVSPSHKGFYDLLKFRKLGAERSYSEKLHDPVIALRMNVDQYRTAVTSGNPTEEFVHNYLTANNLFIGRIADWGRQARREFLNSELLEQLFVKERNFLAECSPAHLKVIQRRWGQELFGAVSGHDISVASSAVSRETPIVSVKLSASSTEPMTSSAPVPDAMVIFAGRVESLLSSAMDRVTKLFSLGTRESEETWEPFASSFNSGVRNLAVANSVRDVMW